MTHDDDDRDALAAEYVLGTLDPSERAEAEALVASDAGFAGSVRAWERRLGELQAMVDPIEPPPAVWDRVRSAISGVAPGGDLHLPVVPEPAAAPSPSAPGPGAEIVVLARRASRWRGVALAAGALAAALLVFVAVREFSPALLPAGVQTAGRSGGTFVAVLQQSASSPAFLLTVDVDAKSFTVRRVGAARQPGKSYELWLVSDSFPQPRSLGLIGADDFTTRAALAAYDPETINKATYAVSLEPEGGSPTGVPTGPVLFAGTLIQAVPE